MHAVISTQTFDFCRHHKSQFYIRYIEIEIDIDFEHALQNE